MSPIVIFDKTSWSWFTLESMTPEQNKALRDAAPSLPPRTQPVRAIAQPDGEIWLVSATNIMYRVNSNLFSSARMEDGVVVVPSIKKNRICDRCGGPDGLYPEVVKIGQTEYLCQKCRA